MLSRPNIAERGPKAAFWLESEILNGRVAPVSVTCPNPDEGAPGPSPSGIGDVRYATSDTRTKVLKSSSKADH